MNKQLRLSGVAAFVGGVVLAGAPTIDTKIPGIKLVLPIIPIMLLICVRNLQRWSKNFDIYTGNSSITILTVGLILITFATLLFSLSLIFEGSIAMLFIVALPALIGGFVVAIGMVMLAHWLWKIKVIPLWVAIAFSISTPIDPLANALITPVLSVGISVSGIAWIILGYFLMTDRRIQSKSCM